MKSIAVGSLLAAGVLLSPLTVSEAEAYTTFHLAGHGGLKDAYVFEEDDIELTVTAATFSDDGTINDPAKVGQYYGGLGVTNSYYDGHWVDGRGRNDLLIFTFDHDIELHSVTFTYADYNDDFHFFFQEVDDAALELEAGNVDLPGGGWWHHDFFSTYVFSKEWIGDAFGIGADYKDDEFKVKKIKVEKVEPVPLPAPVALLGGALLALAAGGAAKSGRRGS